MDAGERAPLGAGRLLLRFGVGLVGLTRARADALLAAASEAAAAETLATGAPPDVHAQTPLGARHAALGLLLELLDGGQRAPAFLRAQLSRAKGPARRLAGPAAPVGRLVRRVPGVAGVGARLRGWRVRGAMKLAGWALAGRREEGESLALARAALTMMSQAAVARLADSPKLKEVIREQSEGIAVTAVTELRDRSARADTLAEGAVRRLFRGSDRGGGG